MKEFWKQNAKNFGYLALIVIVVSVPLMTDYVLGGSNLAATLSQIKVMSQGMGEAFPLRIGTLGTMDYGYSAASFQGNVFFLIPAGVHRLGMELGAAYKWTLFLCNLTTTVIAYYSFTKCTGRQDIGLLGSMLYTWNHYRCSEMYLVGDLGEVVAWSFLPLVLLGIKYLYAEDAEAHAVKRSWIYLTWGLSLVAVSSTVVFFCIVLTCVLVFLFMGKKSLTKSRLLSVGKAGMATLLINAWFLLPMLLRMRDVSAVAPLLLADIRGRGMYFAQYLVTFAKGGGGVGMAENGMQYAQAMGPGIVVVLLLFVCIWLFFTGKFSEFGQSFVKRMMWVAFVLVVLSTNAFPWDLLQNKNMLFSIILALMYTPAKLGIGAGAVMIFVVILMLKHLTELIGEKEYKIATLLITAMSFGSIQYLLGDILTTRGFAREPEIEALSSIQFSLILQESVVWRICEVISLLAIFGCVIMWIVRRRKKC